MSTAWTGDYAVVDGSAARRSVLHVCSAFAKHRLYADLTNALAYEGVLQHVYVPVRSEHQEHPNHATVPSEVKCDYAHVLRRWHRLLFRTKIRRIMKDVVARVDLTKIDVVHAHFLYSDGAVALRIKQMTGIPYVVAVRNTDVNGFMRLRPDLARLCRDVLAEAHAVVFVTPAYLDVVTARLSAEAAGALRDKAHTVPNGIDDFWLESRDESKARAAGPLRLLYVGDFSRNKNIPGTIRAASLFGEERPVILTLVGAGGNGEAAVDAMLATGKFPFVRRLGRIDDRARLASIYKQHDIFVMPSYRETFGVVYLEALSQGLPVIFSRGQGIDGYFAEGVVGEAVNPADPGDIKDKLAAVANRLEAMRARCVAEAGRFAWPPIARIYADLYAEAAPNVRSRTQ